MQNDPFEQVAQAHPFQLRERLQHVEQLPLEPDAGLDPLHFNELSRPGHMYRCTMVPTVINPWPLTWDMKKLPRTTSNERILHKEVNVSAPIDRVWWAWTTSEGMASWWTRQSWIELRIDGPYELYFLLNRRRGSQGSESCRILSYLPHELLVFSWNFPPSIPEIRIEHTWVILRFSRVSPSETHVALDQLGWKKGPVWEKGWSYFDEAWGEVLEAFRTRFPRVRTRPRQS